MLLTDLPALEFDRILNKIQCSRKRKKESPESWKNSWKRMKRSRRARKRKKESPVPQNKRFCDFPFDDLDSDSDMEEQNETFIDLEFDGMANIANILGFHLAKKICTKRNQTKLNCSVVCGLIPVKKLSKLCETFEISGQWNMFEDFYFAHEKKY